MTDSHRYQLLDPPARPYHLWARDAKAHLQEKELWDVYIAPSTDDGKKNKAAGKLWSLLGEDAKTVAADFQDAKPQEMWDALQEHYAPKVAGQRFSAYSELLSCHLREGESLSQFAIRVKDRVTRLKSLRDASYKVADMDQEVQAMVLLRGVPDTYRAIVQGYTTKDILVPSEIELSYRLEDSQDKSKTEQDVVNPATGLAYAARPLLSSPAPMVPPPHPQQSFPPPSTTPSASANAVYTPGCYYCGGPHRQDDCERYKAGRDTAHKQFKNEQSGKKNRRGNNSGRGASANTAQVSAPPSTSTPANIHSAGTIPVPQPT